MALYPAEVPPLSKPCPPHAPPQNLQIFPNPELATLLSRLVILSRGALAPGCATKTQQGCHEACGSAYPCHIV